jgi:dTDP-4-dehydrorhamnose 3,5-epimerase/reductase
MDSSRFLILGANGQVGKALQAMYPDATAADRSTLDISDTAAVAAYDWSGVDVILNAAAYTKVDAAETPEGRADAWAINAQAVGNLARVASEHQLTLVHISTDYVFDGSRDNHTETETFTPLGVYGQSKAAGDIAAATTTRHYILRVSWVIGDGPNFVRTMINLASRDISPSVVADQVGRLTFSATITGAVDHLLQTKAAYGTYNLSNAGQPASWAAITRTIFAELGRDDLTVTDTTTEAYYAGKPDIAPRPLQSTMDLSKITATGLTLRDWQADLHDYIQAEQATTKE